MFLSLKSHPRSINIIDQTCVNIQKQMWSLTLNVPVSQINIKRSITNEILKSLWFMSCPHWSWRLGSHGFPLPGVFLTTWFHSWISFMSSSSRNIDFSWPPVSFMIQIQIYIVFLNCLGQLDHNTAATLVNERVLLNSKLGSPLVCLSPAIKLLSSALPILSVHFFISNFYVSVSVPYFLIYFGNLSETGKFCAQLPFKQQLWWAHLYFGEACSERQPDISWLPLSNPFPPPVPSAFF